MIKLEDALVSLARSQAEFVIIGGVAAALHGSLLATYDLDLCYSRETANLSRVASALAPFQPKLRSVPPELPFVWGVETLRNGFNFTLSTDIGALDLFADIPGVGDYRQAREAAISVSLFGHQFAVLTLDALIRSKRAIKRPKDLLAIPELEALRDADQN